MVSSKQLLAGVAGLLTLGVFSPVVSAQPVINPGFQISPLRMSLPQAAINHGLTGQTYPGLSNVITYPYANPLYNPLANPIINPYMNPAMNPALNPAALANYYNPYAAFAANPLVNPYTSPYTNPAASPYSALAANPFVNPYGAAAATTAAASLTSTPYANPYGAYDMASMTSSPYSNPYGYYESPIGGYMRGTADLMSAEGRWMVSSEQARVTREHWRREQIENRKRAFDLANYIRNNTPTPEEDRQRYQRQQLTRALNDPPYTEVLSGQALNLILDDLARMRKVKGAVHGPSADLDEDVLRHTNFTKGPGGGNAGLLKNDGHLSWPATLRGDEYRAERESLSQMLPDAVDRAISNGRVDSGALAQMRRALDRMNQTLADNIRDLPPNQYIEARRYLGYLDDALRVLGRPDAGDYLTFKKELRGRTVGDLVNSMLSKGLSFAPATPGDEAAYMALYRALAAYDNGAKTEVVEKK